VCLCNLHIHVRILISSPLSSLSRDQPPPHCSSLSPSYLARAPYVTHTHSHQTCRVQQHQMRVSAPERAQPWATRCRNSATPSTFPSPPFALLQPHPCLAPHFYRWTEVVRRPFLLEVPPHCGGGWECTSRVRCRRFLPVALCVCVLARVCFRQSDR